MPSHSTCRLLYPVRFADFQFKERRFRIPAKGYFVNGIEVKFIVGVRFAGGAILKFFKRKKDAVPAAIGGAKGL